MKKKFRRKIRYVLARIAALPLTWLPLRTGVRLGGFFGKIVYYIIPRGRRPALKHLRIAFAGRKSEKEIKAIAKEVFVNVGRNGFEWINYKKLTKKWMDKHIHALGRENIDRVHKDGRSVIFLISHFGNWELMGFYLAKTGYAGPSIARRVYMKSFDKLMVKMRNDMGVGVVYRDELPKEILRTLRNNGFVGILIDQDVRDVDGVFVDFFGKPAWTATGAVKLAKKTNAAVIPVFLVRENLDNFTFIAGKEIKLDSTGSEEKDIFTNTQKLTKTIESYIEEYPDHWMWMHRRWRTKPEDIKQ